MTDTWAIIDFGSLVWQEFYGAAGREATPSIIGAVARGRSLAAVYGAESRTIWCLDQGPYLRAQLYPPYKANRAEDPVREPLRRRLPELPALLGLLGYGNILTAPGFEADDHVAAAVAALPPDHRGVIISRDKDLHQLIGPRVVQFDPVAKELLSLSTFRAQYDLHPSQWVEVLALAGCSGDNVAGCRGAGIKTAVRYLAGTLNRLHAVYLRLQKFDQSSEAQLNRSLVQLPFSGTPPVRLQQDEPQDGSCWTRFVSAVGAPGTPEP